MKRKITKALIVTIIITNLVGCSSQKESKNKEQIKDRNVTKEIELVDNQDVNNTRDTKLPEKDKDKPVEIVIDTDNVVEQFNKLAEDKGYKKLIYTDDFVESEGSNKYIIVFTSKYCDACKIYTPILFEFNNTLDTPNLYLVELTDESNHDFANDLEIDGTPTTVVVEDGKIVKIIDGALGSVNELLDEIK